MVLYTFLLSGGIAGLIGMAPLMADPQFGLYGDQFPQSLGFTGLSLALLGRNHPFGVAAAALVWATIERATQRLSFIGIPSEIGTILQGSFLLAAVIAFEVVRRRADIAEAKAPACAETDDDGVGAQPPKDNGMKRSRSVCPVPRRLPGRCGHGYSVVVRFSSARLITGNITHLGQLVQSPDQLRRRWQPRQPLERSGTINIGLGG